MLRVCEMFGETIRNMFGCGCYFVVECYGGAMLYRQCMVFQKNVCVVPVIPMCI